jgi:hypothetical protein
MRVSISSLRSLGRSTTARWRLVRFLRSRMIDAAAKAADSGSAVELADPDVVS